MDGNLRLLRQAEVDLVEEKLRRELDRARAGYDRVSVEFQRISESANSVGLDTVDGAFALRQAAKEFNAAFRDYRKALDRFYDFVLRDMFPDQ